ncbi:MacS family sensor histidine kinase [Plantactinospora sp. CA-290183]|uniref:MacS family sensor histidine kinase n=1 Tax=Plantactinospora sp. CA-290183 TaxID=3240006 RepID=UPI003D93B5E6
MGASGWSARTATGAFRLVTAGAGAAGPSGASMLWEGLGVPEPSIAARGPGSAAPAPSLQAPLWRSIAVYRFAALAYVAVLTLRNLNEYAHPVAAVAVLLLMAGWSVLTAYAYADPARRRWPLLLADLAVALAVLLVAPWVVGRTMLAAGVPTLSVAWLGGPVLAWAVSGGRRRGVAAALVLGTADLAVRETFTQSSFTGPALMLLAGIAVGHVARLAVITEERLQRAVELEAATRERERLARDIHDSVLQVLALVQRRGADLDGEAGELARLAGEQEAALRSLVATRPLPDLDRAEVDLRAVLGRYASPTVSIAAPATPVPLAAHVAREVGAAVGAALDNVARHGGERGWLLVEDDAGTVTVSVRDDGPGIPEGRLAEAAGQGRLGVAQSIRGRIAELGGTVRIVSAGGQGTEVELRIPRTRPPAGAGPEARRDHRSDG